MTDDEALGRLVALASADHHSLRYAAVFGLLKLEPDAAGTVRRALDALENDPHPGVQLAAQIARERVFTDDDNEPVTAVDCPTAIRRASSAPPPGDSR